MPLALLIGLFAWLSVVAIVLALCRAAARGDMAATTRSPRRHPITLRTSLGGVGCAATTRVAARADSVGHRLLRRTEAR